jgi:hypothetical protein
VEWRTERAEVIIVDRGRRKKDDRRRWMGEIIGRTESEIDTLNLGNLNAW